MLLLLTIAFLATEFSGSFLIANHNLKRHLVTNIIQMKANVFGFGTHIKDLEQGNAVFSNGLGSATNENDSFMYSISTINQSSKINVKLTPFGTSFKKGDSFVGFSIKSKDPEQIMNNIITHGGSLVTNYDEYSYGASMIPDEDEMKMLPVKYGKVTDASGHVIEVMSADNDYPSIRIMLNVLDLEESIKFYTEQLGMALLRKRSNVNNRPRDASLCAYVGYGNEKDDICIELVYNYAVDKLTHGNQFELILETDDLSAFKSKVTSKVHEDKDGSISISDPNGYKIKVKSV